MLMNCMHDTWNENQLRNVFKRLNRHCKGSLMRFDSPMQMEKHAISLSQF